jgi:hypothetical protein
VPPLDSRWFSQVNGGQNGMWPIPVFFIAEFVVF